MNAPLPERQVHWHPEPWNPAGGSRCTCDTPVWRRSVRLPPTRRGWHRRTAETEDAPPFEVDDLPAFLIEHGIPPVAQFEVWGSEPSVWLWWLEVEKP